MKKKPLILVISICVVLTMVGFSLYVLASEGRAIVTIGDYKLTEATLKEYVLLEAMGEASSDPILAAAQEYVKAQIAAEEIRGTEYDIPENYKEEMLKQETQKFQQDLEDNTEFCQKYELTKEELIAASVTAKVNSAVQGKHLMQMAEQWQQTDGAALSAEELLARYEQYMEEKLKGKELVILGEAKVQSLKEYGSRVMNSVETEKNQNASE